MKWPLAAYRVGLVIFLIVILLITIMAALPVLEGDISVEREKKEIDWNLENETLTGEASLWINNSGHFDFQNILFDIQIEGLHSVYMNSTQRVEKIGTGEERKVELTFSKNISEISDEDASRLLQNDTEVNMTVKMEGEYSFSLFAFTAEREDMFHWGAPFNDLSISDLSYSKSRQEGEVDINFYNNHHDNLNIEITLTAFDSEGDIIDETRRSYTVPAESNFDETIKIESDRAPDHSEVRFEEKRSGMEYTEELI